MVAPISDSGGDQTVQAYDLVTLDGSGSSDPDGTVTGYAWRQISGAPAVTLSSTSVVRPTFKAPGLDVGSILVFGLIVTDNTAAQSTESTVTINVNAASWFAAKSGGWTAVEMDSARSTGWDSASTLPGAPTSVSAVAGNAQATVTFVGPGSSVDSYRVTCVQNGLTVSGLTSPLTVSGLTNGTPYTFTVAAHNGAGWGPESAASNSVTPAGLPAKPAAPTAVAGDTQATVSFVSPGGVIDSYRVTSTPPTSTVTGATSPIVMTGLTNNTAYTFKVAAHNAVGWSVDSDPSAPITPMGVPAAPAKPSASAGDAQAVVTFTSPGGPVDSYRVTSTPASTTVTGTVSPITVTGLTNGQAYTFKVAAHDPVGWGADSPASDPVTPTQTAPANFATDTWSGTDGATWSGQWTMRTSTAPGGGTTIQGNKGRLQVTAASAATRRGFLFAAAHTDQDVVFALTPPTTGEWYFQAWMRCDNSGTGNVEVKPDNGYCFQINASKLLQVFKRVATVETTIASVQANAAATFNIRCQVVGTTLRVKTWTGTEPSAWGATVVDATFASGYFGVGLTGGAAAATVTADVDDFTYSAVGVTVPVVRTSYATETWTGADGAAWPAQWTMRQYASAGGASTIVSNKGRLQATAGAYGGCRRGFLFGSAYVDPEATFVVTLPTTAEYYLQTWLCCDTGTSSAVEGKPVNGYSFEITAARAWNVKRRIADVETTLATFPVLAAGATINLRCQVLSGTLKCRSWTGTEPGTWDGTVDDTTFSSGYVGVGYTGGNAAATVTADYDNLALVASDVFTPPPPPTGGPAGPPGSWVLDWSDEFNGTSVDTSRWSLMEGANMNGVTTHASNVAVSGGNVILTLASSSSGAFISTDPGSGANPGYLLPVGGYAEASCLFPGDGSHYYNWSAWWVSGANWPAGGEHDIAEVLDSPTNLTVNYHSPSGGPREYTYSAGLQNAYHTYGLHRKATTADIYLDGVRVVTYGTSDNGVGECLLLNVGMGSNPAYGAGGALKCDWVRAWRPG